MKGSVTKRCGCAPTLNARGERIACKLRHGSWYFVADAGTDPTTKRRRQLKRGGFATKAEAEVALAEALDAANKGRTAHDGRQTVETFLARWLDDKARHGARPTTLRSYRSHVQRFIVPAIGAVRLRDLRPSHVEAVFAEVAKPTGGRTRSAASVRQVHATLRSALGTARRRGLIAANVARDAELPRWSRPKVSPWEPAELGRFLDHAATDPLGALYEVIAATGLRRGEALGLRWDDVDLERGLLVVRRQVVHIGTDAPCPFCERHHRGLSFGVPKTASGEARIVELDGGALGVLMAHQLAQDGERRALGGLYADHGLVFARPVPPANARPRWLPGDPLPPEVATKRFGELVREAGVRPVRLHDLRHGQASLMLAAGVPLATVSKRLGHGSLSITSDTYSHLLQGVGRDAAERAAALVPRAVRGPVAERV